MGQDETGVDESYRDHPYWLKYQPFYRADMRRGEDDAPVEEWWPWRDLVVHLDRLPDPDARVKVILIHGAGGYGRLFLPYAALANNVGAEAVTVDLPGYGLTRARRALDYQDWVDCTADLVRAERERDGRPIVLVGGSMGGMLAYGAAALAGAAGVVATALLDTRYRAVRRGVARWPWLGSTPLWLLHGLGLALDRVRVPIRWLANMRAIANDSELARTVCEDPYGGGNKVSLRFLRTFLASAPPVEPEDFSACPVVLAHPAADAWTPVELSRPFFDRLACPKELVMLENTGHFPVEEPGITQLEEVVRKLVRQVDPAGA